MAMVMTPTGMKDSATMSASALQAVASLNKSNPVAMTAINNPTAAQIIAAGTQASQAAAAKPVTPAPAAPAAPVVTKPATTATPSTPAPSTPAPTTPAVTAPQVPTAAPQITNQSYASTSLSAGNITQQQYIALVTSGNANNPAALQAAVAANKTPAVTPSTPAPVTPPVVNTPTPVASTTPTAGNQVPVTTPAVTTPVKSAAQVAFEAGKITQAQYGALQTSGQGNNAAAIQAALSQNTPTTNTAPAATTTTPAKTTTTSGTTTPTVTNSSYALTSLNAGSITQAQYGALVTSGNANNPAALQAAIAANKPATVPTINPNDPVGSVASIKSVIEANKPPAVVAPTTTVKTNTTPVSTINPATGKNYWETNTTTGIDTTKKYSELDLQQLYKSGRITLEQAQSAQKNGGYIPSAGSVTTNAVGTTGVSPTKKETEDANAAASFGAQAAGGITGGIITGTGKVVDAIQDIPNKFSDLARAELASKGYDPSIIKTGVANDTKTLGEKIVDVGKTVNTNITMPINTAFGVDPNSIGAKAGQAVFTGVGEAIIPAVASIATGGSVLVPSLVGGVVGGLEAYGGVTTRNQGVADATTRNEALFKGATEAASEIIVGGILDKVGKGNKIVNVLSEGIEENASGIANAAYDGEKYTLNQAITDNVLGTTIGGIMGLGNAVITGGNSSSNSNSNTGTTNTAQSTINPATGKNYWVTGTNSNTTTPVNTNTGTTTPTNTDSSSSSGGTSVVTVPTGNTGLTGTTNTINPATGKNYWETPPVYVTPSNNTGTETALKTGTDDSSAPVRYWEQPNAPTFTPTETNSGGAEPAPNYEPWTNPYVPGQPSTSPDYTPDPNWNPFGEPAPSKPKVIPMFPDEAPETNPGWTPENPIFDPKKTPDSPFYEPETTPDTSPAPAPKTNPNTTPGVAPWTPAPSIAPWLPEQDNPIPFWEGEPTTDNPPIITPGKEPEKEPTITPETSPTVPPTVPPTGPANPTTEPDLPNTVPATTPSTLPITTPGGDPEKKPVEQPGIEPEVKPKEEPKPDTEPKIKPTERPIIEPEIKPEQQPITNPTIEPEIKPGTIPEPEPIIEPEPDPNPDPDPDPITEPQPDPNPNPIPEPEPETVVEVEPEEDVGENKKVGGSEKNNTDNLDPYNVVTNSEDYIDLDRIQTLNITSKSSESKIIRTAAGKQIRIG